MPDPNYNQAVSAAGSLSLTGTGINSTGTLYDTGGTDIWNGDITLDANPGFAPATLPVGIVSIGVANPLDVLYIGNVAVPGTGVISDDTSLSKPLPFNTGLSIVGAGTVVLTQDDTYTGSTFVNPGATLRIQNPQALGGAAGDAGGSEVQDAIQRLTLLDPSLATASPHGEFTLSYNGGAPWCWRAVFRPRAASRPPQACRTRS